MLRKVRSLQARFAQMFDGRIRVFVLIVLTSALIALSFGVVWWHNHTPPNFDTLLMAIREADSVTIWITGHQQLLKKPFDGAYEPGVKDGTSFTITDRSELVQLANAMKLEGQPHTPIHGPLHTKSFISLVVHRNGMADVGALVIGGGSLEFGRYVDHLETDTDFVYKLIRLGISMNPDSVSEPSQ